MMIYCQRKVLLADCWLVADADLIWCERKVLLASWLTEQSECISLQAINTKETFIFL